MKCRLLVQDFEVSVHLGCSAEEQKYSQPVRFNFEIDYQSEIKGRLSDRLEEATDYVQLTSLIKSEAQKKNYQLIEHLNHQVFEVLIQYLKGQSLKGDLKLSVHKLRVPVENLRGGVIFTCQTSI